MNDLIASESPIAINRNERSQWIGIGDRIAPEYANKGEKKLADVIINGANSIRWRMWNSDARLRAPKPLVHWLAERKVTAPLRAWEENIKAQSSWEIQIARWRDAMPKGLAQYWDVMIMQSKGGGYDTPPVDEMIQAVTTHHPDPRVRARVLYHWFGSGEGPWSGFSAHEGVVDDLLERIELDARISALTQGELQRTHLEGAARHFSHRPDVPLPKKVKEMLFIHSQTSTLKDNRNRGRRAFGPK